ncbi:hypothetical protein ACLBOM_08440 [Escherichia coli]
MTHVTFRLYSVALFYVGLCAWLQWQDIWLFYSWHLIFSGLGEWTGSVLGVVIAAHADVLC